MKIQAKRECIFNMAERSSVWGVALADTPEMWLALKHRGGTLMAVEMLKKNAQYADFAAN